MVLAVTATAGLSEDPPTFLLKWGSVGTGDGQFQSPFGIGVDPDGNVYVVDTGSHRVQKFSGSGVFLGKFGIHGSAQGQFDFPVDVAIAPNGEIYVSDQGNTRVQVFNSSFAYVRQWQAAGAAPLSIAMDPEGQFLYTTIFDGHVVQYDTAGTFQRTWGYSGVVLPTPIGFGVGSDGSVYISAIANDKVRTYSRDGQFLREWGDEGVGPGQFDSPLAVAVDANENVYVADESGRIQKFSSAGLFLTQWGSIGTKDGQFEGGITDIAIDSQGNIYALEPGRAIIHKFSSSPTPTRQTTWGRLKALYR